MTEYIIFSSIISGIVGTSAGCLIGLAIYKDGSEQKSYHLMAFATGVIAGLFCFSIIPESLSSQTVLAALVKFGIGAIAALLAMLIFKKTKTENKSLVFVLVAAVIVHNLPEGIALGTGFLLDPSLGIAWLALITLHNVPIGTTIGIAQAAAGSSRFHAMLVSILSGVPILAGGIITILIGSRGLPFSAGLLPLSGGALLMVILFESRELFSGRLTKRALGIFAIGLAISLLVSLL